jgi:hypothetical protein
MRMKTEQNIGSALTRRILGWDIASKAAKDWWGELESINEGREDLVMKLIAELISRQATIEDFFLACSYSGREGVSENLKFLDLIRQDNESDTDSEDEEVGASDVEPFLH